VRRRCRGALGVLIALTRAVSPTLAACELTHLPRAPIDVARAEAEHAAYEDALRALGATVVRVPPAPDLPDAVFVEDAAVVLDELAVVARPGAAARRGETATVATALARWRTVSAIAAPATLDGGDVLRVGRTLYVGLSSRTAAAAAAQLEQLVQPFGYQVVPVEVRGCLHLKSAVTAVGDGLLLANANWVSPAAFAPLALLPVDPAEPGAANALRIGSGAGAAVVFPAHHPRTARRLEEAGVRVVPVPCGEIAKAEGGVTCCSLLFEAVGPAR
jgi:dimethylargininase